MSNISFRPETGTRGGRALFGAQGDPREPRVGDVMTTAAATVPAFITMAAARRVAALKQAELLLVAEGPRLLGLITATELATAADEDLVSSWTKRAVVALSPTMPLSEARELMMKSGAACLPVLAGALMVGVVTRDRLDRGITRPRPSGAGGRRPRRAAAA